MKEIEINDLYDYTPLHIFQDNDAFKFSLDSVLLAEYVNKKYINKKIVDFCTGNAVVPMILNYYGFNNVCGIEYQKKIYDLAVSSIDYNNINNIRIINEDVKNIDKIIANESIDVVTCNPPYFKVVDSSLINDQETKAIARHEIAITLNDIIIKAAYILKNKGIMYLVHRSERLSEILVIGKKNNMIVKEIQPIMPKETCDPSMILIKLVKNGNESLKLRKPIIIDKCKTFKQIFEEV